MPNGVLHIFPMCSVGLAEVSWLTLVMVYQNEVGICLILARVCLNLGLRFA
jgi:hypothetical protein